MELVVKKIPPMKGDETDSPLAGRTERTYLFFKVTYNHHRDVSHSTLQEGTPAGIHGA